MPNPGGTLYDLLEHRHRFSVWAAARAAQRGCKKASVSLLRDAVERCGVVEFVTKFVKAEVPHAITEDAFSQYHSEWCGSILKIISERGVEGFAYGRAAKLVGIYLKSMVVLGTNQNADQNAKLARIIHPPIDGILLRNMSDCPEIISPRKAGWKNVKWTKLKEDEYFVLVSELRQALPAPEPFWKLERFWTVAEEQPATGKEAVDM
ncbi:MAG TPA: hypothetical protein VFC46_09165 [Humisphaera sp.]|nr:hypothetical protein [Humisphaera sp.]